MTPAATIDLTETKLGFGPEALDALIASRPNDPDWVRDRRRESFHVLMDTPLPTRTDEAWRRTDFGSLKLNEVETVLPQKVEGSPFRNAPKSIKEVVSGKGVSGAVAASEGDVATRMLTEDLAKRGVIFTDMDTAVRQHSDLLEPIFMTHIVRPNDG